MAHSIIPRQEGRYWRVRVRRPAHGLNVNERFHTQEDAQAYINHTLLPLLSKGEIPEAANPARMSFSQLVELYLEHPMLDMTGERELKPASVLERTTRLNVLKRIFSNTKLNRMTSRMIETKLGQQEWNQQSRQKYEVALNRLFEWGRSQRGEDGKRLVAANPMRAVVRSRGSSKKLRRTYTADEWKTLLDQADQEPQPLGLFLRLLRATGFRKSELHGLLWEHVKPTDRAGLAASLYLPDSKSGSPRTAFIKDDIYQLLLAHEQEHRRPGQPRVFSFKVDPLFRRVREEAGLHHPDARGEHLTIHAIRRTFATELGKRGATLAQMRAAGGWKTAEQAMRYMQVDDDLAAEAALLAGD